MILTVEQTKELEQISKPLVKFLCDNFNPHVTVIITPTNVEILFGSAGIPITEFVKD